MPQWRRRPPQPSDRARVPPPLLKRRLPSGRGAMSQPNVTSDGPAALTASFWVAIVITGVVSGLIATALMALLRLASWIGFGAADLPDFERAVKAAVGWDRVWPLLLAGAIAGPGWYLLRRFTPGLKSEADDVLWSGKGRLSFRRSAGTSVLSEIVVGLGASLGREAAPKLMGAVTGNLVAERMGLSAAQLRLLVACGAGAGFAAVYNVPLGGALFTAEVLIGAVNLPIVLPALGCSAVATVTAWLTLPHHQVYLHVPNVGVNTTIMVFAVVLGPVIGAIAAGYIRLIGLVSHYQLRGRLTLVAPLAAFAVLAVLGLAYPQLYGNGADIAQLGLTGGGTYWLFVALFFIKPLVTLLCLGSGASGGLFTPVLATGAAFGGAVGLLWNSAWPGTPLTAYVMVAAAAMIGAGMQAPLAGLVLMLELTDSGYGLMVPMIVATALATAIARWIDGYSIYSARLAGEPVATSG